MCAGGEGRGDNFPYPVENGRTDAANSGWRGVENYSAGMFSFHK